MTLPEQDRKKISTYLDGKKIVSLRKLLKDNGYENISMGIKIRIALDVISNGWTAHMYGKKKIKYYLSPNCDWRELTNETIKEL